MPRDLKKIIGRHRAFWELSPVKRPLIGYCVGGWSQFQQYKGAESLPLGPLKPDMLKPRDFLGDYERILAYNEILKDDLIRSAEPFPPLPWMEAIMGCSVYNSGKNI